MQSWKKFFKARSSVRPLHETIADLARWYETPLGQSILTEQREILSDELSCLFGYHLMQLSVVPYERLFESSRINHCFSMAPAIVPSERVKTQLCDLQALSDLDALPLADESIDVTILHHVLDFSENPQQVLKEAARVTVPRGHIIIICFNPFSMMGALQPILRLTSSKPVWRRKALRAGRLRDWLEFLDFSCVNMRQLSHNLPINHSRYLAHSRFVNKVFSGRSVPFGSTYCILARKDKVGLTPLKPEWDKASLLRGSAVAKQSLSARTEPSARILPLRRRPRTGSMNIT
ncbi:class I SAM-dependent methyltransferase [Teredinibacter waterburyi]|jgi:Methylase involved in ubiquinone/menaquinone biosynthesis|uniref:class I SAM-dependent methyltransferase n=1 Tax=Teredinibacter waterburyi TaxID=1500538 RepID=UPI00165FA7F6|nr:class I SAM-dependent methyltransferase [Teredinibacter waterburyi]